MYQSISPPCMLRRYADYVHILHVALAKNRRTSPDAGDRKALVCRYAYIGSPCPNLTSIAHLSSCTSLIITDERTGRCRHLGHVSVCRLMYNPAQHPSITNPSARYSDSAIVILMYFSGGLQALLLRYNTSLENNVCALRSGNTRSCTIMSIAWRGFGSRNVALGFAWGMRGVFLRRVSCSSSALLFGGILDG